ncbi:MAG: hypothetical protein A2172_01870 [Candidatus Woykebacteria bacterium RBG_13_40_15]|uniref:Type IV pilus modification protein PilV n=1 Tax=Candidatus Woykebacteria bacterium RBG_13_40_15 TaxID=1802593 RepID=A0A1G1W538_9BACT|nr:MAG: hypothetical protein A2172_01870 [Candidatus Woykebacteria bacterium RBG_13_40_15]
MKIKKQIKIKGMGLVEILIVLAVVAVGFLSILSFLIFSRGVTFQAARNTKVTALAEEGIEAVRSMRDESWAANVSVLASGTTYYPVISSGKWSLSAINPGLIDNLYTRTIVVSNVSRDANDNISASGTNDPNTKKVVATVTWQESGRSKSVVLTTYITNFLDN